MVTNNTIHPFQKVFLNFSLIFLGIAANTMFFNLMVTLLGTVVLGSLNSQNKNLP